MKLYQVVETTKWPDVWERFVALYPGYANTKALCYDLYNELKSKSPLNSQITIKLMTSRMLSINGGPEIVDIVGVLPNNDLDYGIEFCSSEEWLGMDVDLNTLGAFSHSDIVSHCIFGLSGVGYVPVHTKASKRVLAHYS